MITSFNRIWHLRELVLINGSSPESVVRWFPLLLCEIPWRKRIRAGDENEIAGNCRQWKIQIGIVRTSFWIHGYPRLRDFEIQPWCQCSQSTLNSQPRPLSKNFFLQIQRYKVKVFYYRYYNLRDLWVFFSSPNFHNLTELFVARWLANFYQ